MVFCLILNFYSIYYEDIVYLLNFIIMFKKNKPNNNLKILPWSFNYDQIEILKLAIKATWKLEKLNGLMYLMPNKEILISPMLIKESVDSSEIENIHTTTKKVLQSKAIWIEKSKWAEKEVLHYHDAILYWYEKLKNRWWLWYNDFLEIQKIIEPNKPWIRTLPWTIIADWKWIAIYTPPEWKDNIDKLLLNLEKFMNNFDDDIELLIKMPIIHYQFESIHPFYDWNWRTWRILNILYLILSKKLNFPILFLSEYINDNRNKYYELLWKTHENSDYTNFIIFILEWIIKQADLTSKKILKIQELMKKIEEDIEKINMDYHKIAQIFFSNPFTSIKLFQKSMWIAEITATRNIKKLETNNIIKTIKIWRNKLIYIPEFIKLLS